MKKLLLFAAFAAVSVSYMNAEPVVLQVADASDYVGTFAEEKRKDDGSLQEAAKWQPISSFKISGYTISPSKATGGTEPAIYLPPTDKPTDPTTFRVYKNNTVSIAAPENASISSVSYILKGKTEEVAMDGSFADGVYTWTNGTGSNLQIVTLSVTLGEPVVTPDDPVVPGEEITLDVLNAADLQGETVEEVMGDDGKVQAAKHIQPLESLEIDDYLFSFTSGTNEKTAPAYYWPTSTATNGKRSIRLYAGNTMTITAPEGVTFSAIVAVPDNSSKEVEIYKGESVNTYTFTATATTRINIFKVNLAAGETPEPPSSDIVFENTFENDLNGFDVYNAVESEYTGWKLNSNPKCAIANSYVGGKNVEAETWLTTIVDLTGRTECSFSFEQGFGYTFPDSQVENYTILVRNPDINTEGWSNLEITNYPEKPASGNWTKEWALNTFDISEFDGQKIQICLVYKNDGSASRAWEIKNFVVKGKSISAAIESMESDTSNVVYYTLQGVKVVNPTNGLYIRVQNGKSKKIMMK